MVLFVAGTTCIFPFSPLLSMPFPLCPPSGGKGPVMGALPPFEAPFQTPESPPVPRAEALCSLPACSNKSFAFGTGGRKHPSPHGGGMKSGQGYPPSCVPRPSSEGLSEGGGHDLRNPNPSAGRYGGKGKNEAFSLVAPPCDPVSASPSVPKAKLLLEHEDTGRTGRRSTLKGKGDSGGGCKEGPRGGNRRFSLSRFRPSNRML